MDVLPQTQMGRRALWLLLPVLLYPLYWSVLLLIPDSCLPARAHLRRG